MDPFDPNFAFTTEGLAAAVAALDSPGSAAFSPPPAAAPGPGAGYAPATPGAQGYQQPPGQEVGEQDWTAAVRQAEANARAAFQPVLNENATLRGAVQQVMGVAAQTEEQRFQASLDEMDPRDGYRAIQQRAAAREWAKDQQINQLHGVIRQTTHVALAEGYTNEVFNHYAHHGRPLSEPQMAAIRDIPADNERGAEARARQAAVFDELNEQIRQGQLSQAATFHVASGASRVGGTTPAGAAYPQPTGPVGHGRDAVMAELANAPYVRSN